MKKKPTPTPSREGSLINGEVRRRKTLIPGPSPKGEGGYSLPPWGKGWGRG